MQRDRWIRALLQKVPTSSDCGTALSVLVILLTIAMVALLSWLFVRAAMRLEFRWDNPAYHLPFAAMRGRITTTFLQLNENLKGCFDGFPPLPELAQGLLWRLSGDIHATNVVNFLAFLVFLVFCITALGASFWLVVLLSLAAPHVLIQLGSGYVDLFGNAWIAVSLAAVAKMAMDGDWRNRTLVSWCIAGLILAAWSKFQMVPLIALITMFLTAVFFFNGSISREEGVRRIAVLWAAVLLASVPYIKNWLLFGNPFWPLQVRVHGFDLFPFLMSSQEIAARERPPSLPDASQSELFVRSLLEIGHPTSYPHRERWIIDQGNASISFRSGGLWASLVIAELLAIAGMSLLLDRRRGLFLMLGILVVLAFVSVLPQSHELRYYMFLALAGAAIAATLFPAFSQKYSRSALAMALTFVAMLVYVLHINHVYLRIEQIGFVDLAKGYMVDQYWPNLRGDVTYCTVNMGPLPFLLTGPTMNEFKIIDALTADRCPANTVLLKGPY